jgi:sigma-E factor negative regulatory protein RseA
MNKDKEKISAWLDDGIELDEVDSLQAEHGTEVYSTATRYHMIGDAIRGSLADASMIDISASVSEAISREPEFSPRARPARASKPAATTWFGLGSWLKPVGGLAVAATVAMVMVVTLTDQQTESGNAIVANVGQQPVQALPVNNAPTGYTNPGFAVPAVNLNSYVTEHSEYAARDSMQGMMPYARAVSYGAEKNTSINQTAEDNQTLNNPRK